MIINVDRKTRSIQLSIKAKDNADQQEAMQRLSPAASAKTPARPAWAPCCAPSWTTARTTADRGHCRSHDPLRPRGCAGRTLRPADPPRHRVRGQDHPRCDVRRAGARAPHRDPRLRQLLDQPPAAARGPQPAQRRAGGRSPKSWCRTSSRARPCAKRSTPHVPVDATRRPRPLAARPERPARRAVESARAMRIARLARSGPLIFFTLFAFALNNQQEVAVHWFFGLEWHAPMVIVVLARICRSAAPSACWRWCRAGGASAAWRVLRRRPSSCLPAHRPRRRPPRRLVQKPPCRHATHCDGLRPAVGCCWRCRSPSRWAGSPRASTCGSGSASRRARPRPTYKGLNLLLNEQHDKAIDAFIEAVQHDPDTTELHFALGNLFRRRGEYERAVRVHQHLLQRADLPRRRARPRAARAGAGLHEGRPVRPRRSRPTARSRARAFDTEARLALLTLHERSRDWRSCRRRSPRSWRRAARARLRRASRTTSANWRWKPKRAATPPQPPPCCRRPKRRPPKRCGR